MGNDLLVHFGQLITISHHLNPKAYLSVAAVPVETMLRRTEAILRAEGGPATLVSHGLKFEDASIILIVCFLSASD